MTRAPRSARWRVARGAATACSMETTVIPSSGRASIPLDLVSGGTPLHDRAPHILWRVRVHVGITADILSNCPGNATEGRRGEANDMQARLTLGGFRP